MRMTVLTMVAAALIATIMSGSMWAQSTAQINGTVRDQSGAVMPGVDVTVTQTATGLMRTAVTNGTGLYVFANLPIGPYHLEAALPGFRSYVHTGIILQVGSNPQINAVLEVGQVAEAVEVTADAALVETRSTGVGRVIDNQRVLELPLNGRQATELIFLSGMATPERARPAPPRATIRRFRSPSRAASRRASRTTSMARTSMILTMGSTSRFPFPTRCRNSRSKPAVSPPSTATTLRPR